MLLKAADWADRLCLVHATGGYRMAAEGRLLPNTASLRLINKCAKLLIVSGVDAYKALADPTRRKILKLLRDDDLPAGVIAVQFDMSWPSVSRHLGVLTSAGLVKARRQGQQVIYSLTTSVLADIVTELADMGRLKISPRKARAYRPASSVPPKLRAARS